MVQGQLFFLFTALSSIAMAVEQTLLIGDSDSHVQYLPPKFANENDCKDFHGCNNKWWSAGQAGAYKGAVMTTWGSTASLHLSFQGSSISVIGVQDKDGARANVLMDDEQNSASVDFNAPRQQVNQTVFSRNDLDPSVQHTLHLVYDPTSFGNSTQRKFVRVDAFIITFPDVVSPFPTSAGGSQPTVDTSTLFPASTVVEPGPFPSDSPPASSTSNGTSASPAAVAATTRTSTVVPVVAGLVTGLVTLLIAGGLLIFFLRRRRRAVPVQSMTPVRLSAPTSRASPTGRTPPAQMRGLVSLASYAFTRHGSSVTSSADTPPRPASVAPPVPQLTQHVSPYNYRSPALYPVSIDSTSLGPPVDERPPNIPRPPMPASPQRSTAPRVLLVHNPDTRSAVSSNYSGG